MKRIIVASALMFSFVLEARTLNGRTTCNTMTQIERADNATLDDIKTAVSQINQAHCGVEPKRIIITL